LNGAQFNEFTISLSGLKSAGIPGIQGYNPTKDGLNARVFTKKAAASSSSGELAPSSHKVKLRTRLS
jgi:hypothetical protein